MVVLLFVVHPASTGTAVDTVSSLHIVALIPARFASSRLPGKPLADIDGRPMIEHVYRRVSASPIVSQVIVATDDLRIATRVHEFGGHVRLTKAHETGTDRLAEVAATLDCDLVVNVQGDEPLIDPGAIAEAVAPFAADPSVMVTTLFRRITQPAELTNPNVVKVVVDRGGFALYFSRSPIPHLRDPRGGWPPLYKHVGLYAYRRSALMVLASLEPTPLERAESLEQLRALEHGIRIKAVETKYDSFGVDTPEDLEQVRRLLAAPAGSA
ncbi:MAG TPA: 3-deoxy-manno-octulosonate cytidylyltransferase [Vicinamibacterales bacterium]|jgi:3-deoxy-manno-octulosonate cytidylyltransferase (CMP-KDO synthetase)|nr:3-deoxy-manno-octulosonate cytidylyltransferase [Vicinamibacterales bacterium]